MALVVKDRVKQTTTTTGTGSIVLNGNVDGFQTFAAALANGDTTYYSIFVPSTNAYEVGLGTWTESSATLARTTVLESSNSGSAINITAQAEVFIAQPAEKAVYLDSSNNVTLSNNLTVTGDFTVSGTTTTIDTTNSVVTDSLIELANGTSGSPSNDAGIVIERGSSDNAFIGYDESADKFTVGTGSFTGASTGNLTISTGTLVANVEGNVTGNVTGNVSGSSGSTTGNAATATALETARTIGGVSFDGTANINLPGVNASGTQDTSGNAATATALETARTIGGVSFDGTANINLPGVNTSGNQDTSGNAATATTAGTVTTAAQTNITSLGTLTTLTVDDITINGSTISDAADLTVDVGGAITLDADGGYIDFADGGTTIGRIENSSSNFKIESRVQDKDIVFAGNDGGSGINALILDMSEAGAATFNSDVIIPDKIVHSGDTNTAIRFPAADTVSFETGSLERARIDSSGNFIVGKTTTTIGTAGTSIESTGKVEINAASTVPLSISRITDEGDMIALYEGSTLRGRIGIELNDLFITSANSGIRFDYNNTRVVPCTVTGAGSDNTDDFGDPAVRWKDGYFAGQIHADRLVHDGDTNTYIVFGTDQINFYTGGSQRAYVNNSDFVVQSALKEDYDALSGTSPTIDVDAGGAFSLTMTGNTTFTFSSCTSGVITGFVLQLTGNGGTVTYPNTVDFAGGTAPDAPANGETDILVFITRDGGTNWYGALAIDAAA